ncbi:hypothetical protein BVG19_g4555 [[Candida] boidinii]|nr:hypothetical protein BVG19_g4555 [[Candida] boidinii]OWB53302.1 hypothetical protein B5S27_g4895 [[Candida] boidinii]
MGSNVLADRILNQLDVTDKYSFSILSQFESVPSETIGLQQQQDQQLSSLDQTILNVKNHYGEVYSILESFREANKSKKNNADVSTNETRFKITRESLNKIIEVCKFYNDDKVLEALKDNASSDLIDVQIENLNPQDTKFKLKYASELQKLTYIYITLVLYFIASEFLFKKTLSLNDDLSYFDSVLSSKLSLILYNIQVFPIKFTQGITSIYDEIIIKNLKIGEEIAARITPPSYIPESMLGVYVEFMKYFQFMVETVKSSFQKIVTVPNSLLLLNNQSIKSISSHNYKIYISNVLRLPLFYATIELKTKRDNSLKLKDSNVKDLGFLLREFPNFTNGSGMDKEILFNQTKSVNDQILINFNKTIQDGGDVHHHDHSFKNLSIILNEIIPELKTNYNDVYSKNSPPTNLTKNWIYLTIFIIYGPRLIKDLVHNRKEIADWIETNLVDTLTGFWKNWIVEPVNNILKTVRHDDNSRIAIMSQKSLNSDLESLERMVIDYTLDNLGNLEYDESIKNLSRAELVQLLTEEVRKGDLTPVMIGYETDLKKPVKSMIIGDMIRNLLIQIQKAKVDGTIALSGIDKILKSQELVFGIVAASPSCLIIYYLLKSIKSYINTGYIVHFKKSKKIKVCQALNSVERILTLMDNDNEQKLTTKDGDNTSISYYNDGLLFLQLAILRKEGLNVLPKDRRKEWVVDINDLIDSNLSYKSRLLTIQRIWNNYGYYLRN